MRFRKKRAEVVQAARKCLLAGCPNEATLVVPMRSWIAARRRGLRLPIGLVVCQGDADFLEGRSRTR